MKKLLALFLACIFALSALPGLAEVTAQPETPDENALYIIPDSSTRALTAEELWAYTRETLRYIRNEILARHGYIFGNNKFGNYFGTKDWYVSGNYNSSTVTGQEWRNIELIKSIEHIMDELKTENETGLDITVIIQNQKNGTCPG